MQGRFVPTVLNSMPTILFDGGMTVINSRRAWLFNLFLWF